MRCGDRCSHKYFNNTEPPTEWPTKATDPVVAASLESISAFHAGYGEFSSSGICGHCTS